MKRNICFAIIWFEISIGQYRFRKVPLRNGVKLHTALQTGCTFGRNLGLSQNCSTRSLHEATRGMIALRNAETMTTTTTWTTPAMTILWRECKNKREREGESIDSCRTLWGPSETVSLAAREKRREGPWEERAICIPNDRMTFARCIKMPLIDGARENTFGTICSMKSSERASTSWLLYLDGLPNLFKAAGDSGVQLVVGFRLSQDISRVKG